jgi:hypothetical protein
MAENEKKKAIETVDYDLRIFPEVKVSEVIDSSKYSSEFDGKKLKVVLSIPVPETDEQAKEVFNLSIVELVAKGVRQAVYGESFCTDYLKELVAKGQTELLPENLEKIRLEVESALFATPKEKKSKAKKAEKIGRKAEASGLEESDFESEEFQKFLAKYKAMKAKASA